MLCDVLSVRFIESHNIKIVILVPRKSPQSVIAGVISSHTSPGIWILSVIASVRNSGVPEGESQKNGS